jgi:hypothetical protein
MKEIKKKKSEAGAHAVVAANANSRFNQNQCKWGAGGAGEELTKSYS